MSNEFLLKQIAPATTQVSQPQDCCCPLYAMLPFLFHVSVQWSTPKWFKLHPEKKNCHYLNCGCSANAPKSTSSSFFSQFIIFTCLHEENQQPGPTDLERISQEWLSFCCERKVNKSLLLCDVGYGFPSCWKHWPEFEKWPWEVWTEKEFTQTWNEWPGLLQLHMPTHFTLSLSKIPTWNQLLHFG